jgi:P4 family phage/plasmid primase-like protien
MLPPQQLPSPELLKETATRYYNMGLNVVPIHLEPFKPGTVEPVDKDKHKQPMISWRDLQSRRQTEEEFNNITFDAYINGFGVICGQKLPNGLYFGVVDYDVKKLPLEIVEKGNQIRKQFPITQTEETGSKGIHLIYLSRNQVEKDGDYHDLAALELLGNDPKKDKCTLCIMAPSYGYTFLNDSLPTEVEDLTALFYQVLDKNGVIIEKQTDQQMEKAQRSLFKIEKLVDLTKLNQIGDCEYQGCHPYHESSTEKNFSVNTKTDSWYCFRHGTGGGPLQLLAIKEGLLACEDVKAGAIKGAKYRKVIELAVTEGLIDKDSLQQVEINPILLAKDIMGEYSFIVEDESNTLYFFDKNQGIYSDKTERLIKREIARYLDENTRTRYYAEVENFIIATSIIKKFSSDPELLACQNGILNVITGELKDFTPEHFLTIKIPVTYNPQADCQKIKKFLSEILEEPQRLLAQEFIGYCLYRDYPFHKAYIANGTGSNGKTVHQNLNTALLGQENLSNQTIQNINHNRFSCAELHNKLGNFCDDLPSNLVRAVGNFKMATGGGIISAERKGKDPFNFANTAKFWLNCNDIPPITKTDDNDAYFRRIIINDYRRKFTDKEANKNLINELTTTEELSGYLNYAIEGLKRIIKQGHFSEVMTLEETRSAYIKRSDSRQYYLEKFTQETDNYEDIVYHSDLF